MVKYIFEVTGMMCPNCEKHTEESVKKVIPSAKVKASFTDGKVEVVLKKEVDENDIILAIKDRGYVVKGYKKEVIEDKGLFSFFKK